MACKRRVKNVEKNILTNKNTRSFYNFVNNNLKYQPKISPLLNENSVLEVDTVKKCEILAEHFKSVLTIDNGEKPNFSFPFLFRSYF